MTKSELGVEMSDYYLKEGPVWKQRVWDYGCDFVERMESFETG